MLSGFCSSKGGRRALRAVLSDDETRAAFDAIEGVEGCALFVLTQLAEVFDHALALNFVDRRLNRRDWTGLEFALDLALVLQEGDALAELEARLPDLLAQNGPRPRIAIERFTRHDLEASTGLIRDREQFTIYVEGPPEAMTTFDEEAKPERRMVRRLHEAAIVLDVDQRTLDIVAKGGKETRRLMAKCFVELMLAPGPTLAARARRTLALEKLKTQTVFALTPEDGVRQVEIIGLTLGAPDFGSIVTHELGTGTAGQAAGDFNSRAHREIGNILRGPWRVLAAKIRITFEPEKEKARRKRVTLELRAPDRTNLRDQLEHHRRIADALLDRWGLYEGAA